MNGDNSTHTKANHDNQAASRLLAAQSQQHACVREQGTQVLSMMLSSNTHPLHTRTLMSGCSEVATTAILPHSISLRLDKHT